MINNTNDLINDGNRCAIPWLHAQISLQNNTVSPCCKYRDNLGPVESFVKIWKGPKLQQLRDDILNQREHSNCSSCNVPDTVFSYRSFKNTFFINNSVGVELPSETLPKMINISLKNTCNLACRMCSPFSSSKLGELSKKSKFLTQLYQYNGVNNKFNINSLSGILQEVEYLTVSGGEPLIDLDCYELIKLVKEESKSLKVVVFSTNFTKPSKNILDLLSTLDCKVHFNVSIDGDPVINDYIRYGSKFDHIVENISANRNFSYGINSTISVLNVGYLPELLIALENVMKETGIKFTQIMSSPVLNPHLHVGNLPKEVKEFYIDKLKKFKNTSGIHGSQILIDTGLDLLSRDMPNWCLTEKFLNEFDVVTNTSYKDIYPELNGMMCLSRESNPRHAPNWAGLQK